MIERIRWAIRDERYRLTMHAIEEMAEDNLQSNDLERIILTGHVARSFTRDPRGTRYEVVGSASNAREGAVVCRFLPDGVLLILTAYAIEED